MTGIRGVLIGALSLIALQTIVSTSSAASRTAGLFHDLGALVDKLIDPSTPLLADHSKPHPDATPTTTSATYTTTPPVNPKTAPAPRSPNGVTVNPSGGYSV